MEHEWPSWQFGFDISTEEGDPTADYLRIHRRPIDPDPLSAKNMQSMQDWIAACVEQHDLCRVNGNQVPTRLLDFGTNSTELEPRLVITADEPAISIPSTNQAKYAALSYCWGNTSNFPPLVTNKRDITDRMSGIALSCIPQTILDAITVTRLLEIRYLWVDALCIVQDDEKDWQKESAMMTSVYGNAFVTIVAARGSDSHAGFLEPQCHDRFTTLPFRSSNHLQTTGSYRLTPSSDDASYCEYWRDILASEWDTRAWTHQEYAMSKRILFFGKRLHFECHQIARAEFTQATMIRYGPSVYKSLADFSSKNDIYSFWYDTISLFSGRRLTIQEDLLPAISGIAHLVAAAIGDRYFAGLWSGDILTGLLWREIGDPGERVRYLAPSWSWAACDQYVQWRYRRPDEEAIEECDIVDVQTSIIGEDAMGRVSSGYLTLSGRVKRYTDQSPWPDEFWSRAFPRSTRGSICWETRICAILLRRSSTDDMDHKSTPDTIIEGLVLSSAQREPNIPNDYIRIGSFRIQKSKGGDVNFFEDCPVQRINII
ncbi:HET-domain-containing protein [Lophium mytilinum]|uniref:HET-domain-containing protein n=1 Tax=Lophium mytilinum TaxID=390894 RepID=A0A6A6QAQ4_9PEZI|nr:HET-domain-containing protein [Lophium mytilinum]